MHKKIFFGVLVIITVGVFLPELVNAAVKLPSWASDGNIENKVSGIGKKVADILAIIVGILGVLGILAGALMFPLNKADVGKQYILWSGVGLVISGSVYGIANLFISS